MEMGGEFCIHGAPSTHTHDEGSSANYSCQPEGRRNIRPPPLLQL